ncbi:MAG: PIN domain-containing protein [Planctomycetaceae bacterium]|nr:PIN domain-containing protein [Planctomycetaceae bacterium]
MMTNAVLDANVLFSAVLRDLLLRLAADGLFEPFWSAEIQDEWVRNLLKKRPDLKRENLERTCRNMDLRFPNGLIRGYESLIPALTLPDEKDRHVLAAAIHVKANCIVTFDLDHFPKTALESHAIEAISPDKFATRLFQKDQYIALKAIKTYRINLTRPSKTVDDYLTSLEKQRIPQTVAFLREHRDDI